MRKKSSDSSKTQYRYIAGTKLQDFLLVCLLSLSCLPLLGQSVTVKASIDTSEILIGQQSTLTLRVDYKTDQGEVRIEFPKIADTLIKEIEVLQKSKIERFIADSSDMSIMSMSQTLIITSFDSGYYAILPFKFVVNGDSSKPLETEPLLFSVSVPQVDTTIAIKEIKPPIEVPFSWKELLPYFYAGMATLAILSGLIYLVVYWVRKQKNKPTPKVTTPQIPAHVIALQQLEKLKEEKLWQNGKLKEYYSGISDIVRQYIEKRFFVNAMEQVTFEIMHSLKTSDLTDGQRTKLRQILLLSDLVKFAKEHPLPQDNESSWANAYDFILSSRKEDKEGLLDKDAAISSNDEESKT